MVLVLAYTLTFLIFYSYNLAPAIYNPLWLIRYEIAICYLVPPCVISQVTTRLETFYTKEEDHTKEPTNP
jgi:hypothetical protein